MKEQYCRTCGHYVTEATMVNHLADCDNPDLVDADFWNDPEPINRAEEKKSGVLDPGKDFFPPWGEPSSQLS